jgi:hypothetical protein
MRPALLLLVLGLGCTPASARLFCEVAAYYAAGGEFAGWFCAELAERLELAGLRPRPPSEARQLSTSCSSGELERVYTADGEPAGLVCPALRGRVERALR